MTNSYEQMRENAEGEVGTIWRDADRWSAYLAEKYRDLDADKSLSAEGKHEKATELYKRTAPRVTEGHSKARSLAREEAKKAELSSIPMPEHQTLGSTKIPDATALLAVQNATTTLLTRIENQRAKMPAGIQGARVADLLRREYGEGLESGGVEGRTQCRAALNAANALGVELETVVDSFRTDKHRAALDRARRNWLIARAIPGDAPTPPFSGGSPQRGNMHSGGSAKLFQPRRRSTQPANPKKKNPWAK